MQKRAEASEQARRMAEVKSVRVTYLSTSRVATSEGPRGALAVGGSGSASGSTAHCCAHSSDVGNVIDHTIGLCH
eukprot:3243795-Pyramimonas_sp.AAC.1